jgi:hypothetical protein
MKTNDNPPDLPPLTPDKGLHSEMKGEAPILTSLRANLRGVSPRRNKDPSLANQSQGSKPTQRAPKTYEEGLSKEKCTLPKVYRSQPVRTGTLPNLKWGQPSIQPKALTNRLH